MYNKKVNNILHKNSYRDKVIMYYVFVCNRTSYDYVYGNREQLIAGDILETYYLMIKYNVVKQVPYVSAAST